MAPSSSKKRRRADSEAEFVDPKPTPILFSSPGLKPDVRLDLFGKVVIHCHSLILKLHSNFFRKSLDSPDKTPASASSLFRYKYTTVINEDGTWALEHAAKICTPTLDDEIVSRIFPEVATGETISFRNLLSAAMYNRTHTVECVDQLVSMVQLAGYYCALLILSATLSGGLLNSPMFAPSLESTNEFHVRADELIFTAKKLRNITVFRECLVRVASNWRNKYGHGRAGIDRLMGKDPDISRLVGNANAEICAKILKVNQRFMLFLLNLRGSSQDFRFNPAGFELDCFLELGCDPSEIPDFYLQLMLVLDSSNLKEDELLQELKTSLKDLLASNLILDRTWSFPGKGHYNWVFLSVNVSDEEMPWDTGEVDW